MHTPNSVPTPRVVVVAALVAASLLGACGTDDTAVPAESSTAAEVTTTTNPTSTTAAGSPADGMRGPGGGSFGTAPAATEANVAYATTSAAQVLDMWLPADTTGPTPLVVYVHGGAFKGGDKAMVGAKVQPLLDAGYAVASLNYRLSGEATFPAGAQDVKAAVRWLRANAATYNLDPDRFAAWGESAGGNLVALLGTSGEQTTVLDDAGLGNADTSSAVQAVVDWYGPTDFAQMDDQATSGEGGCSSPEAHDPASSPESLWVGGAVQETLDTVAEANPITYISTAEQLPAFSIAHGDADCNVPFQQSQILADALQVAGAEPELTILPGASHADSQFDATLLTPTIEWLDTVLGS
jgi:acetyl esterase/lipase